MNVEVLVAPGEFASREIPRPDPTPHEVLIEVAAVAICGSDLAAYQGRHPAILPPTVLGHEFSGRIASVGSQVAGFADGDPVCVDPTFGCGNCRHCKRGRANICDSYTVMGRRLSFPGAMAGFVSVPADHVYRLPPNVDLEAAALVQPLSVGYHAAVHRGRVQKDAVILIAGGGAVGMGILMAAKEAGAIAIVTDMIESRRVLARELGADIAVDPASEDLAGVVAGATDGYGVDIAFEAVGGSSDQVLLQLINLTSRGGTTVVVGLKTDQARIPVKEMKYTEKTITGSQAHPDSFSEVIERIGDGRFQAGRLISHRLPFVKVADAFDILDGQRDGVMKIILTPGRP